MQTFNPRQMFVARAVGVLACAVGAWLGAVGDVSAATFRYMNGHNFQVSFFGNPSLVPINVGFHRYTDFAFAQTNTVIATDWKSGLNLTPSQTVATATTSRAWAQAHSDAAIHQTGVNSFAGSYSSYGNGVALDGLPRTQAFAFSSSALSILGGVNLGRGRFVYVPLLLGQVSGFGNAVGVIRNRDPLEFEARDATTGTLLESGKLVQIDLTLLNPTCNATGEVKWDEFNVLTTDADDYSLLMNTDSPFVSSAQRGTVDFVVTNGVVTKSNSSGAFAGLLPGIGSSGRFSVAMPSIEFDYDLNALNSLSGRDYTVEFLFSNSSTATVPEPSTIVSALVGIAVVVVGKRGRRSFSLHKLS